MYSDILEALIIETSAERLQLDPIVYEHYGVAGSGDIVKESKLTEELDIKGAELEGATSIDVEGIEASQKKETETDETQKKEA